MKKFFPILVFYSFLQIGLGQTAWAPIGSTWWTVTETGFSGKYVNEHACIGTLDTLGHSCKVIHTRYFDGVENDFYSYQEGEKVYFYNALFNEFVLQFDYSKQAGEQYAIEFGQDTIACFIDSIGWEIINGDSFSIQYATVFNPNIPFSTPQTKIYKGIGTDTGLGLSFPSMLTPEVWTHLGCYESDEHEVYTIAYFPGIDCQALSTDVDFMLEHENLVTVFPNPTSDYLNFYVHTPNPARDARFRIINAKGRLVKEFKTDNLASTFIVPVWDWADGIYWLQVQVDEEVVSGVKFIITK